MFLCSQGENYLISHYSLLITIFIKTFTDVDKILTRVVRVVLQREHHPYLPEFIEGVYNDHMTTKIE